MQLFPNYFFQRLIVITFISCCFILIGSKANSASFPDFKQTIILDPGHGGFDTGAKGADNTLEKKITLLFANKIQSLLKKKYNIILTRNNDYWVSNHQRSEIANNSKADLFISIHTNASFIRETKGISFIYYKPSIRKKKSNTASNEDYPIEWDLTHEKFIPLSHLLANTLFEHFSKKPDYGQPRVKNLPIYVLSGLNMPAILIEIAYLTNPFEEQLLNNQVFLSNYSKEICAEIELFLKKYKKEY